MFSFKEDTFGSIWSLSCLTYWCLMDFWVWRQLIDDVGFILWLCIRYSHWGIFPRPPEIPICYCAVWLSLFMVIEMFGWFWQTLYCTSDIHTGAYSPLIDEIVFRQWYEDGWSLFVVCLTTLTSDLILGHISPIFFEYPWDWDSGQFGFRLSTSPELPTIDCIRASLHGFVEIEMDRIRFHPSECGWIL